MRWTAVLLGMAFLGVEANGAEPRVQWIHEAVSQLYAPPLVADMHPSPGLETVISDSEAKRLRCIDAAGNQLWEYDGGWKKRLTSSAALSFTALSSAPGEGLLVVGNPDGSLDCIHAQTGARRWKTQVGRVEWSNAIWTDLNGDGVDEIVVGSEETGLTALDADANILWTFAGKDGDPPLSVQNCIAAGDIDGDGKAEVFACGKWGPVCVNGDGTLRWQYATGDDFSESAVLLDNSVSGSPAILCISRTPNLLQCFEAKEPKRRWFASLVAPTSNNAAASIALGSLAGDRAPEFVVPDGVGNVYCFTWSQGGSEAKLQWLFKTEKAINAAVTLGDVDGDGQVEALVSSGDHHLYCLGPDGALEWKYATELRIISPPTLADVNRDGALDILLAGSDGKLRCLTLDAPAGPLPWPARRFDHRQSGAWPADSALQDAGVEIRCFYSFNGGFELAAPVGKPEEYPKDPPLDSWAENRPLGWHLLGGGAAEAQAAWGRDGAVKKTGEASLRLGSSGGDAAGSLAVVSESIALDPGTSRLEVSIASRGDARAELEVLDIRGVRRTHGLRRGEPGEDGWSLHASDALQLDPGDRWVRFVLHPAPEGDCHWDDARAEGIVWAPRKVQPLVNQVGYDLGMPKHFVVQANYEAPEAAFELLAEDGSVVHRGTLDAKGRIVGAFDSDWGHYYWRGDFTGFDMPGRYRIRATLGNLSGTSGHFEIGEDLLASKTARLAYRFFYYQRCGMEIPGYHGACHLDDSTDPEHTQQWDLTGGWHDAGDYNKYHNAPYVLGLGWAYERQKDYFDRQDEDGNGIGDFLDEIIWGGDHAARMIAPDGSAYGPITSGYGFWGLPELETDNKPGTGDERPTSGPGGDPGVHAAAVAKVAKHTKDPRHIEAAARALQYGLDRNRRGPLQFSAAIDLYLATNDEKYAQLAREMAPGIGGNEVETLELYDRVFGEDHSAKIREALVTEAEALLANARNPFGVWTFGPPENPNFFGTPQSENAWHVGNSQRMLDAASRMAMAYRYNPDPRYLVYVYDQFNWTLGCNPYDTSMMEGAGYRFPPTYHQRLTFGGLERGAIPGGVINGLTFKAPGDDRPFLDTSGLDIPEYSVNEVWLPHNTAYLNALVNLRRIVVGSEAK